MSRFPRFDALSPTNPTQGKSRTFDAVRGRVRSSGTFVRARPSGQRLQGDDARRRHGAGTLVAPDRLNEIWALDFMTPPHAERARRRQSRGLGHRGRHVDPGGTGGTGARSTGGALRASPSAPARQRPGADSPGLCRMVRPARDCPVLHPAGQSRAERLHRTVPASITSVVDAPLVKTAVHGLKWTQPSGQLSRYGPVPSRRTARNSVSPPLVLTISLTAYPLRSSASVTSGHVVGV